MLIPPANLGASIDRKKARLMVTFWQPIDVFLWLLAWVKELRRERNKRYREGVGLKCAAWLVWSYSASLLHGLRKKTTGKGEEAGQRSLVSLLSESNGVNSITNCATRVPTPSQPWPGDTTPAHKNSGHKSGKLPPIDPLQFEMFSAGRSPHWQDQLYQ